MDSCFSYDGELNSIANSNSTHWQAGLAKYKNKLITVGGYHLEGSNSGRTEQMERMKNGTFIWSVVAHRFSSAQDHSLVTVPPSDMNEEFVLLIGGTVTAYDQSGNFGAFHDIVLKFNGTWSYFGMLKKRRKYHSSIYWNGAVYVIGGIHGNLDENRKVKMEVWKIHDSPNEFNTSENWPELFDWFKPHLFIVEDSFFPDY